MNIQRPRWWILKRCDGQLYQITHSDPSKNNFFLKMGSVISNYSKVLDTTLLFLRVMLFTSLAASMVVILTTQPLPNFRITIGTRLENLRRGDIHTAQYHMTVSQSLWVVSAELIMMLVLNFGISIYLKARKLALNCLVEIILMELRSF